MALRPMLGPAACRFYPSCGVFAIEQLQSKSLPGACWAIAQRLFRCR